MTVAAIFSVLVLSQIVMLVIGHETRMTSRDRSPITVTGPIGAAEVPYPVIRGKHLVRGSAPATGSHRASGEFAGERGLAVKAMSEH